MCGIVGILEQHDPRPVGQNELRRMLAAIRHRGPDEFGLYLDRHVGLGSARLSIIDLSTGQQPIATEDENLWIVFNGEIFNYLELRGELESLGHRFRTRSDTEVLLHAYEEFGPQCLERLNGQFAFAVWNAREQTLFLARDRLGVRPLFYTVNGGRLIFASEIKAILTQRQVRAEIDPAVLGEVFIYWAPLAPRTLFRGIREIPPGHFLLARAGEVSVKRYWQMAFPGSGADSISAASVDESLVQFSALLVDASAASMSRRTSLVSIISSAAMRPRPMPGALPVRPRCPSRSTPTPNPRQTSSRPSTAAKPAAPTALASHSGSTASLSPGSGGLPARLLGRRNLRPPNLTRADRRNAG